MTDDHYISFPTPNLIYLKTTVRYTFLRYFSPVFDVLPLCRANC